MSLRPVLFRLMLRWLSESGPGSFGRPRRNSLLGEIRNCRISDGTGKELTIRELFSLASSAGEFESTN